MRWVYLNGRFVPEAEATISVFDHGFLYGDGVYETLRAYGRKIFLCQQHLARLARSAELIGLPLPLAEREWRAVLDESLRRNDLTDAYLRLTVSRGAGAIGLDPRLCPHPTIVVLALPLPTYPAQWYHDGVALMIAATRRNYPAALSPQIKSLNFLNNILAKQEAVRRNAFDALMLNADGLIAECTTSNVFFVSQSVVHTPAVSCGILDGITRNVVLDLARHSGLRTEEGAYGPERLMGADECFLTNTTMEIMPVSSIDERPIGAAHEWPVTTSLRDAFRRQLPALLE